MTQAQYEQCLDNWTDREATAEAMIPLIGRLYREHNVVTSIYGRALVNRSVISLLKSHRFARQIDDNELSVHDTFPVIKALVDLDLGPASIDVARLAVKFQEEGSGDLDTFLRRELASIIGRKGEKREGRDVVLYGFGRIGRLLARILVEKAGAGDGLRLRAVVVRKGATNDLAKRASLLRRDSVHGSFQGTITIDEENNTLTANGTRIQFIYASDPSTVNYAAYGIKDAILVDNTGVWRDEAGLSQHLKCEGISRVVLTAPGKGDLKNIVHGINHSWITDDDKIVSAASCTTNAIVPVLKAMNDKFGINNGHVETVHSYTNDQNLIDNFHKGNRRGRSAALNMVITETGAATAAAKVLPELAGKLDGVSIRVPTPNVSVIDFKFVPKRKVTVEEVNAALVAAADGQLKGVLAYTNEPLVSIDLNHNPASSTFALDQTKVIDGDLVRVMSWYDNEWGFSNRMADTAVAFAKTFA